jgi:Uri superfamily endonuclease
VSSLDLSKLPASGGYRLTVRVARPVRLRVGRLGPVVLPAGVYYYCGSARRSLPTRVARHSGRRKPKRWHVDYLLAHPAARVAEVHAWTGRSECDLVSAALRRGGRAVVKGFGSSDCRRGCPAHLIYMGEEGN